MARKTELYARHEALKGRIIDFAGWMLPVQYPTGPIEEHHTVRKAAGLFDIDHMAQLVVKGPDALAYLQYVTTTDVSKMVMGEARYSPVCYEDGGVVDDVFIYRLPDRYFVAINASNAEKDTRWFKAHIGRFQVTVENVADETYMLALQGPKAEAILQQLTPAKLSEMPYHRGVESTVAGVPTLIGRTGYTGEDGFELYFPCEKATLLWDRIMEAGAPHAIKPIGLAARDSLRFEAKMPLYGQEIGPNLNPIEAGLGWAVAFGKGEFIGRNALLKIRLEGPKRKLVGLEMIERSVPRHGYPIVVGGQAVGEVTTGMFAPTVGRYIALAYVPADMTAIGTEVGVQIRNEVKRAKVVETPFYMPPYRR
ncbi:MAG TPA: glycine cleavage system aminomethyltransferase GcvT [Anaerolineae bacterium]|nr:glycine cleavage system aminomethyltransferase GcvT [Anaerolineae bacterium]HPL27103.1 glycine cleavage system aminomethyltransferase GcvT [Anaerolineae bacterium]